MEGYTPKVFLGGTCGESTWRETLLTDGPVRFDYYNPVVPNWTPEVQQQELAERLDADYVLYVITPEQKGFYAIAELTEDAIKRPQQTVVVFLGAPSVSEDNPGPGLRFDKAQWASIEMIEALLKRNRATVLESLDGAREYLNSKV